MRVLVGFRAGVVGVVTFQMRQICIAYTHLLRPRLLLATARARGHGGLALVLGGDREVEGSLRDCVGGQVMLLVFNPLLTSIRIHCTETTITLT